MSWAHGKDTVVIIICTASPIASGSGADISAYCNNSELSRKSDTEETTTYGKTAKVYGTSLLDSTAKCEGLYHTSTTGPRAVFNSVYGSMIEFVRRPEGTGEGLPQDKVDAILIDYTETNPVGGYIKWAADLQCSDSIDTTPQTA